MTVTEFLLVTVPPILKRNIQYQKSQQQKFTFYTRYKVSVTREKKKEIYGNS